MPETPAASQHSFSNCQTDFSLTSTSEIRVGPSSTIFCRGDNAAIYSSHPWGWVEMLALKLVTAVCIFATAIFAADSAFVGTWKLDLTKSKDLPGTAYKEDKMTFEAVGNQWKRVAKGVDADGKEYSEDSTIAWDGQDHPTQEGMTVAVNTLGIRAIKFTVKHEGKIVVVGRMVVSKDGKTLTTYAKGADEKGRKIDSVDVYDKQ
jgi:hypothetical protein